MRRIERTLLALVAALALYAGGALPAYADEGGGGENAAIAVNEESGSSVFDFAFSIQQVTGDVVDQTNVAVAYASCENCQTVAIALQIVLVMSETTPDVITPTNVAIAINEGCSTCQTLALAYQFVIGRGGPVRFTKRGERQLRRILHEFRKLRKSKYSIEEIAARAEVLRKRLREVLRTELVADDRRRDDDDDDRDRGEEQRPPDEEQPPPDEEQAPDEQPPPEPAPEEPPPGSGTGAEPSY